MRISGVLAVLIGLFMLGPADAQLECELFGCPDDTTDDGGGTDDSDEPTDDESDDGDEPTAGNDESCKITLPEAASTRAVERSAPGLYRANQARGCGEV